MTRSDLMTSNGSLVAVAAAGWLLCLGSLIGAVRLFRSDFKETRP